VEVGLVGDPNRRGRVEPGHAAQPCAWQGGEGADRRLERAARVSDVRPEADVGTNPSSQRSPPAR
jgi:hypothetical protein